MADPTEQQLIILMHAVNLARNESISRLDALRSRLGQQGYDPVDVDAAITAWADYEAQKASRSKQLHVA